MTVWSFHMNIRMLEYCVIAAGNGAIMNVESIKAVLQTLKLKIYHVIQNFYIQE